MTCFGRTSSKCSPFRGRVPLSVQSGALRRALLPSTQLQQIKFIFDTPKQETTPTSSIFPCRKKVWMEFRKARGSAPIFFFVCVRVCVCVYMRVYAYAYAISLRSPEALRNKRSPSTFFRTYICVRLRVFLLRIPEVAKLDGLLLQQVETSTHRTRR